MEAIILAGGLGTRLRDAVPDLPKCMAPIAGKPFLSYIFSYYKSQGIKRFILSLGYRNELIRDYCINNLEESEYSFVIEDEPLGTGGALKLALGEAREKNLLVLNGDTFFRVDIQALNNFHLQHDGDCTLALKPMKDFDRYGAVSLDTACRITAFTEKKSYSSGLINGGIYLLNSQRFLEKTFPPKFSFEKEYLETYVEEGNFFGFVQDEYFIDIGIPVDYQRAQKELPEIFQS